MKKTLQILTLVLTVSLLFASAAWAYRGAEPATDAGTGTRSGGVPPVIGEPDGSPGPFDFTTAAYNPAQPRAVSSVKTSSTGTFPKWAGKTWAILGDSITEHSFRTTRAYHDYIAESTGIQVCNLGISATGYKHLEEKDKAFYQRIGSVPEDADVITIFGGGNDIGYGYPLGSPDDTGTDTLCGCVNTTLDNLYALYPTAQVGIVTPTPWDLYPTTEPGNEMERFADALVEICRLRSIPCLDLYHCSNLRPWDEEFRALAYSKDDGNGIHPDETGHALIAPKFAAFLENFLL